MTATLPARVPAGHAGGGRFASVECPTTYRLLAGLRAPAEPVAVLRIGESGRVSYEDGVSRHAVPAPRCPHGHFARWATANCKPCKPATPRRRANRPGT